MTRPRSRTAALAVLLASAALAGCGGPSDAELEYAGDYAGHPHLKVAGYPTTDTLGLVQQVVWRLADGSSDRLTKLAASEGTADQRKDASAAWVRDYGKGAQGAVTAEFGDDPTGRQAVVLTFHDTGQVKEIQLRQDGHAGEDGWKVLLK
ncbi:hypothetical protein ACIBCA_35520 [Kitasatospora sp. NPDC051170]|uniref:hypothetical protein n=1 Tax=Kitasatospora sp. NPDC051170 TaxID=3364056 RepID=UPI0037AAC8C8